MSISSVAQQGIDLSAWLQSSRAAKGTTQIGDIQTGDIQSGSSAGSSASPATASSPAGGTNGTGSADLLRQLGQDLQSFLLQLQAGGSAQTAGATQTSTTQPDAGDTDGSGSTDPAQGSQVQGRHHHHHHPIGTQETGSPNATQSLASSQTQTSSDDGTSDSSLSQPGLSHSGSALLSALRAYASASSVPNQAAAWQQTA
jgi:hypothetical protein